MATRALCFVRRMRSTARPRPLDAPVRMMTGDILVRTRKYRNVLDATFVVAIGLVVFLTASLSPAAASRFHLPRVFFLFSSTLNSSIHRFFSSHISSCSHIHITFSTLTSLVPLISRCLTHSGQPQYVPCSFRLSAAAVHTTAALSPILRPFSISTRTTSASTISSSYRPANDLPGRSPCVLL